MLMRSFTYPAKFTPDEDTLMVTFRDVPPAITAGGDRAEALEMAEDALHVALLSYLDLNEDIPEPSAFQPGEVPVSLPAAVTMKLAVWIAWRGAGISKKDLASRLGCDEKEARRILDPDHKTKLEALENAMRALGQRFVVTVEAA